MVIQPRTDRGPRQRLAAVHVQAKGRQRRVAAGRGARSRKRHLHVAGGDAGVSRAPREMSEHLGVSDMDEEGCIGE